MTDANGLIYELRFLMDQYDSLSVLEESPYPKTLEVAQNLRDRMGELDKLLSHGGQFPRVWVVTAQESARLVPPAPCGHPAHARGSGCITITCPNYYNPVKKKY